MRTTITCVTALTALLFTPLSAAAHPVVDEGRRLAEEASFEEALARFARAEAMSDLTADDLVALLEGRALVHFAQSDATALGADLAALVAIAPDRAPPRSFSPDLRRAREEALRASAGPIGVRAAAARRGESVVVEVSIVNAPGGLAVRPRIGAQVASGAMTVRDGARREVSAPGGARVAWYAELVGPGGAVIARDGSAREPHVVAATGADTTTSIGTGTGTTVTNTVSDTATATDTDTATDTHADASSDGGVLTPTAPQPADEGTPVWPFVVGGAVLVVGAIVAVALAVSLGSSGTSPSIPTLPSGLP